MSFNFAFAPKHLRAAAAALCAVLLLAGCKTEVYQGLTEQQANAMMAVLMKNGIVPEKTSDKSGYIIAVESDRVAQTLDLMRENNLPRADYENMGEIFAAKGSKRNKSFCWVESHIFYFQILHKGNISANHKSVD